MPAVDSTQSPGGMEAGHHSFLELTVDKFTFRVATDRLYSSEGMWAKAEGSRVRIGVSDYLQQRSGDVAFAEVKPLGTEVLVGGELAVVETIKVDVSLASPLTGRVAEINSAMKDAPEVINQDPYGAGWLAMIEPAHWHVDMQRLLEPKVYLDRMKHEAEQEVE